MAKLNWLDEVKADAEYITKKRIRDYQEQLAHEESKQAVAEVKEAEVVEPMAEDKAEVAEVKKGK